MPTKVRVAVRIRPMMDSEKKTGATERKTTWNTDRQEVQYCE